MRFSVSPRTWLTILGILVWSISASTAQAAELDCRSGCSPYASFAGALWTTTDTQATGSGVIDSFVRIQTNNTVEQGMNTSARPLNLGDENTSPTFTHDIQIQNVPVVTIGSGRSAVQYYEFLLDINQQGWVPNAYLSLDSLQVCTSDVGGLYFGGTCAGTTGGRNGGTSTLRYNMDSATNNRVLLDYRDNSGSGSGDLFVYIPVSLLGIDPNTYVYLYSKFGVSTGDPNTSFPNNDGYEEWAVRTTRPISPSPPVPEPGSLLLLGTGLLAGGRFYRRSQLNRRKAQS